MKMTITDLPDDDYKGKKIFVRVDFNVPVEKGKVSEDYRIRRSIPTIEYLARKGAAVILASHLGRPKGKVNQKLSLRPIADRLSGILKVDEVRFVEDCVGQEAKYAVSRL